MGCLELNIGTILHLIALPRSVKWRLHKLHGKRVVTASHVAIDHYLREGLVLAVVMISCYECLVWIV